MLAVGTRFTEEETDRWGLRMPDTLIHIDIDPEEIDRNYAATVGVVGDARIALQTDQRAVTGCARAGEWPCRRERRNCGRKFGATVRNGRPKGVELVQTLRKALPRETIHRERLDGGGILVPAPARRI